MEIKKKLTVTRGFGEGDNQGRRQRGKSRNMKRGLIDMDNGVGTDYGSEGRRGRGWQWGKM